MLGNSCKMMMMMMMVSATTAQLTTGGRYEQKLSAILDADENAVDEIADELDHVESVISARRLALSGLVAGVEQDLVDVSEELELLESDEEYVQSVELTSVNLARLDDSAADGWHCAHDLPPGDIAAVSKRGLLSCARLHRSADTGEYTFPRGPQRDARPNFVQHVKEYFASYASQVAAGKTEIVATVLHDGSLLHTYVGGDWSKDNDLDTHQITTRNGDGICVCPYSGTCALCAALPPGKKPGDDLVSRYGMGGELTIDGRPGTRWASAYGAAWWLPLPECKNLGQAAKVPNSLVSRTVKFGYTHWYGTYWSPEESAGPEGYIGAGGPPAPWCRSRWGIQGVCGHWSLWRNHCIDALAHYDSNSDGRITPKEVLNSLVGVLDPSWVRSVSRCTLFDGIAAADGMLQYLRKVKNLEETLYDNHKLGVARAKMQEQAPRLLAILPTGDDEASCNAYLTDQGVDVDEWGVDS